MKLITKTLVTISLVIYGLFTGSNFLQQNHDDIVEPYSNIVSPEPSDLNLNKKDTSYSLTCSVIDAELSCLIELSGYDYPNRIIKFAVWSEINGKDDIIWYDASFSNNIYSRTVQIANHSSYGKYFVHAYEVNSDGSKLFLTSNTFSITKPTIGDLNIDISKLSDSKFSILFDQVASPSGIKTLKFAVWSEKNGQDDLRWYTLNYDNPQPLVSGSILIDINNHFRNLGKYNVHLYVESANGISCFLKSTNYNVMFSFNDLVVDVTQDQSEAYIKLNGSLIPDTYSVYFPVWPSTIQSSIKWIKAERSNNLFYAKFSISEFSVAGEYKIHSYIRDEITCSDNFINSKTLTIDFAQLESINVSTVDTKTESFSVTTKVVNCPSGISDGNLKAYIWSEDNGQDDMHAYSCSISQISAETYSSLCVVPLENHNFYIGNYFIHVYVQTNNNIYGFAGSIKANVNIEKGVLSSSVSEDEKFINVNLQNSSLSFETLVEIAVWSDEFGQDDICWYTMISNNQSSFYYNVPISEHKNFGKYYIHCYYKIDNERKFLASTSCDYVTSAKAVISAPQTDIDGHKGTFKIRISEVNIPAGIDKMELPTWGSDVSSASAIWYSEPVKIDDFTFEFTINVNMHHVYFGTYNCHLYIDMGNGIRKFFGSIKVDISPSEYIGIGYIGNSIFRAVAYGFNSYDIYMAKFPTWSDTEWQDDLIWYNGTKVDSHNFYCDININAHRPEGKHYCHVYFYNADGSSQFIGSTVFWVTKEQFGPDIHLLHGIKNGIDVSEHQGWINWYDVANSWGAGFAMIRIGFGWGNANGRADYEWENNYANARASGFPVGGYWYSYARDTNQAAQEAYACLACLNGRYMDLPIAYDLEQYPETDYATNTAMINTFCSIIASAGYTPMVYASESWFTGKFNVWGLNNNIYYWVAQWSHAPVIPRSALMRIWQTGSSGTIAGVSGRVDTDYIYY